MEWLLGLAAALGFFWWLGRPDATGGTSPLAHEVARRATDMNDPDGTFMDGYVAGRLTERAEVREAVAQQRPYVDALDSEDEQFHGVDGDVVDHWDCHDDVHDLHTDAHDDAHDDW